MLELATGILAIPGGVAFLLDPSGGTIGLRQGWIEATPCGSYLVPGLYLLFANGVGMLVTAGLTVWGIRAPHGSPGRSAWA